MRDRVWRNSMQFHFIYLAAGYSRRFGANKLLAPYDGTPMYRVLLGRLVSILESDVLVKDITVVTQYREIEDEVSRIDLETVKPVRCVINPDPSRGISSSIRCAVEYLTEEDEELASCMNVTDPYMESGEQFLIISEMLLYLDLLPPRHRKRMHFLIIM